MPIIKKQQTLFDFVTQFAGSMEGAFEMALLNGIGITELIAPGTALQVIEHDIKTVNTFKNHRLDITTFLISIVPAPPGGIGYMQIGNDFVVS